ncbi:hypothetical protein F5Y16DRAFT_418722 [Xylariaceae sp. FL0255]|nr:hypothetical protein F5Y16DRAFT_418722 [Xylariaceae sp. FL0255]
MLPDQEMSADIARQLASISDLGLGRCEDLANDGKKASTRGHNNHPVSANPQAPSNHWQQSVINGDFANDEDAQAVSGLDELDGGQAHRLGRRKIATIPDGPPPLPANLGRGSTPNYDPSQPVYRGGRGKKPSKAGSNRPIARDLPSNQRVSANGIVLDVGHEVKRWPPASSQPADGQGRGRGRGSAPQQIRQHAPALAPIGAGRGHGQGFQSPEATRQDQLGSDTTRDVVSQPQSQLSRIVQNVRSYLRATATERRPATSTEPHPQDAVSSGESWVPPQNWVPPHLRDPEPRGDLMPSTTSQQDMIRENGSEEPKAPETQSRPHDHINNSVSSHLQEPIQVKLAPSCKVASHEKNDDKFSHSQNQPQPIDQGNDSVSPNLRNSSCNDGPASQLENGPTEASTAKTVVCEQTVVYEKQLGHCLPCQFRIYELADSTLGLWELVTNDGTSAKGDVREILDPLASLSCVRFRWKSKVAPVSTMQIWKLNFDSVPAASGFAEAIRLYQKRYGSSDEPIYVWKTAEQPEKALEEVPMTEAIPNQHEYETSPSVQVRQSDTAQRGQLGQELATVDAMKAKMAEWVGGSKTTALTETEKKVAKVQTDRAANPRIASVQESLLDAGIDEGNGFAGNVWNDTQQPDASVNGSQHELISLGGDDKQPDSSDQALRSIDEGNGFSGNAWNDTQHTDATLNGSQHELISLGGDDTQLDSNDNALRSVEELEGLDLPPPSALLSAPIIAPEASEHHPETSMADNMMENVENRSINVIEEPRPSATGESTAMLENGTVKLSQDALRFYNGLNIQAVLNRPTSSEGSMRLIELTQANLGISARKIFILFNLQGLDGFRNLPLHERSQILDAVCAEEAHGHRITRSPSGLRALRAPSPCPGQISELNALIRQSAIRGPILFGGRATNSVAVHRDQ